jgi:phospholipid/cholesterol/gamma-HCH transport system substrate-binding protein
MRSQKIIEIIVGLFVIAAFVALFMLSLKVSGLAQSNHSDSYQISAEFDNIGGLKEGAPVEIAGVVIGSVHSITLDQQTYRADVRMNIFSQNTQIPEDSSASILTAGILGSQYVGVIPGIASGNLLNHGQIQTTRSALILEDLIGQFLVNMKK